MKGPSGSDRSGGGRPLRIAMVAPESDKYSETFIRDQVAGLPGDVEFLYGGFLPTASSSGPPPTYRSIRALSRLLAPVTGRSTESVSRSLLRRIPIWSTEEGVGAYLDDEEFDVVLAQYGPTGVSMLPACRQADVPLVVHFHGYDAFRDDVLDTWGDRYPHLFEHASALVAVSTNMVDQLVRLGASREKVHLAPCGIDCDRFSPDGTPSDDPELLAVGRFVDKKAPHLTVLAFSRLLESEPAAELHFVGDGPLQNACRTLASALDIESRVQFHGIVPHSVVADRMSRAHCLVQHSVVAPDGDREGTPVSVLEAAASGLPVVATRHEGIADVIEDGVSGLLVEEGDIQGMAEALRSVLADREWAGSLGRAARRTVEERYDRGVAIERLYSVLRSAAGRGVPAGGDPYSPESAGGDRSESVST